MSKVCILVVGNSLPQIDSYIDSLTSDGEYKRRSSGFDITIGGQVFSYSYLVLTGDDNHVIRSICGCNYHKIHYLTLPDSEHQLNWIQSRVRY